jgi:hypothetical protein
MFGKPKHNTTKSWYFMKPKIKKEHELKQLRQKHNWNIILRYYDVAEYLLEKYKSEFYQKERQLIAEHQNLSEEFIQEKAFRLLGYQKDVISKTQKLSSDFIFSHGHGLNWEQVFEYQNITEEQIRKYGPKFRWYYYISDTFKDKDYCWSEKNINIIGFKNKRRHADVYRKIWNKIIENVELSNKFFEEHIDRFNIKEILQINQQYNSINYRIAHICWNFASEHGKVNIIKQRLICGNFLIKEWDKLSDVLKVEFIKNYSILEFPQILECELIRLKELLKSNKKNTTPHFLPICYMFKKWSIPNNILNYFLKLSESYDQLHIVKKDIFTYQPLSYYLVKKYWLSSGIVDKRRKKTCDYLCKKGLIGYKMTMINVL